MLAAASSLPTYAFTPSKANHRKTCRPFTLITIIEKSTPPDASMQ